MTGQSTLHPDRFIAALVALCLLGGAHPLSAQGDRDRSGPVEVRIGVAVIEYLENRYDTRASQPDGVAISSLTVRDPSGVQVTFPPLHASRVAQLAARPLVTDRWMCGANSDIRISWSVAIEERSERDAVVEAVQRASTEQSHGSIFHRLRLEREGGAWEIAEVMSTYSTHGDCRVP